MKKKKRFQSVPLFIIIHVYDLNNYLKYLLSDLIKLIS
jgi:hypothetical protein